MSKPLVRNAADESQVKSAQEKSKLKSDRDDQDLRFVLNHDQGLRVIWKLLETCGVFKSSFTGSSETYFLEGQRNVGLKLLNDIMRVNPDSYLKMHKLNKENGEN